MKRILALLISLMMMFAFVACNNTKNPDNSCGGEIKVKEKPLVAEPTEAEASAEAETAATEA